MLVLYFGNNTIRVRREALDFADAEKDKGASLVSLEINSYAVGLFPSITASSSLFGGTTVYVIDTPSESKEMYAEMLASLEDMKASADIFVVMERALLAPEKKKFQKYADRNEEYKSEVKERFNNFSLADALAKKDKKSLWLLLSEAKLSGIASEELVGVLWWQLKALRLATLTNSASEAGMKDYPYDKAKRALSRFGDNELESLSASLITLLHDSRLGRLELDLALERWVLRV
jgi:DNA polymerase III delta subunit